MEVSLYRRKKIPQKTELRPTQENHCNPNGHMRAQTPLFLVHLRPWFDAVPAVLDSTQIMRMRHVRACRAAVAHVDTSDVAVRVTPLVALLSQCANALSHNTTQHNTAQRTAPHKESDEWSREMTERNTIREKFVRPQANRSDQRCTYLTSS